MTLPRLLLVDDSQAILAYEQAALSGLYSLSTASNGVEALEKARALRPAAILLDLSMPEMNGDQVLQLLKADPLLRDVPVIIVSSEVERAQACLKNGALAYMRKPIQADELRLLVARTLDELARQTRRGNLAIVLVSVGSLEFAVPLANVLNVLPQLATRPLPFGPPHLREMFDFNSRPVCVLDLGRALGQPYRLPIQDRKLVMMTHGDLLVALSVDDVRDPEEFSAAEIIRPSELGGSEHGDLPQVLYAMVQSAKGSIPIVDPRALLSPQLLSELSAALASTENQPPHVAEAV